MGQGDMKRILTLVTLFFFFPYFSLLFFSKNSPSHTMHHHRAGKRSHPIRYREWEKSVSQKRGQFSGCIFPPLFFSPHCLKGWHSHVEQYRLWKLWENSVSLVRETGKGAPVRQTVWGHGEGSGGLGKKMNPHVWIISRLNMYRKHSEKPGKGLEDWRTMETRALVLDQVWVEQVRGWN